MQIYRNGVWKVPYKHTSTWLRCLPVLPPNHWARTDSTAHRGVQILLPKGSGSWILAKRYLQSDYFTTSTFNIRWALLNIQIDQMFQVRTVVHCVHSSPVNGTHVTRVIKFSNTKRKNVNTKSTKCIVLLPLLCHTLATSLPSRVTRWCKLGLLCPLHVLCTQQSQTQWDSGFFSTHGAQWLELCMPFFGEPGPKHNVVNSGGVRLFLPKEYFKWILTRTYLHNVLFRYL